MSWNYRVMYFPDAPEPYYAVHEVYYDDFGLPNGYAENAASIAWEVDEGIAAGSKIVDMMRQAFQKPALRPEDFKQVKI